MGSAPYDDVRSKSGIPARFTEIQTTMSLSNWCAIALFTCMLVTFVAMEHTVLADHAQGAIERGREEYSKRFSPYPYDSYEIAASKQCFWPILTEDDLALLDPNEETATIVCKSRFDRMFSLHETGILIPLVMSNDFSGVECTYSTLDAQPSLKSPLTTEGPTFLIGSKRILVECSRNNSIIYSNEFFNFAAPPKIPKNQQQEPDSSNLSLTIIALDSVSLSEFHRLMPLSSRYMRYMGFIDSEMFNKKDFNDTVNNLLVRGDKPIWETIRDRGCISYLSEGVSDGRVDYSSVDFFANSTDPSGQCTPEGTPIARKNLETLERFLLHHAHKCTFSLQTVRGFREQRIEGNGSVHWFNRLASIDAKLRSTLERLVAHNIAALTTIVVMGDMGNKHNTDTHTGRVQQSTPLFSIRMPHRFRIKRPEETATLYRNRKRLTSNDDIKETLHHIARGFDEQMTVPKELDSNGNGSRIDQATSLFVERYSESRDCRHIGIDRAACQCQSTRVGRTESMGRESPEYLAVRNMIAAELIELPCIREIKEMEPLVQVLEPALSALTDSNDLKDFAEGVGPRGDVEYFRFQLEAIARAQPSREIWNIRVQAHVRHDVRRNKYRLLGEIAIIENSVANCTAQRISDFCQLCTVDGADVPMRKDAHEIEGDAAFLSAVTHF